MFEKYLKGGCCTKLNLQILSEFMIYSFKLNFICIFIQTDSTLHLKGILGLNGLNLKPLNPPVLMHVTKVERLPIVSSSETCLKSGQGA